MRPRHPLAGKTVKLKPAREYNDIKTDDLFTIEDWWENVSGETWTESQGNPAAMYYAFRAGLDGIPPDNEVVYGDIKSSGRLIHATELGEEQ